MKKIIQVISLLCLATMWMVCIFKLSGMNSNNSNGKSVGIISIFIEDALDVTNEYGVTDLHLDDKKIEQASQLINAPLRKVMHALVYFVLAFFIMILFNIIFEHKKYILTFSISIIVCIVFAITDEYHQSFVIGRVGQIKDVIIDSIGATLGLIFYSTYHIIYKKGYNKALNDLKVDNEKIIGGINGEKDKKY